MKPIIAQIGCVFGILWTLLVAPANAIPVVKELSHLPVIVDPSHGVGIRNKVAPMARAAIAAGADGIIVEVHQDPDRALSDGAQSQYPSEFAEMVDQIRTIAEVIGRRV